MQWNEYLCDFIAMVHPKHAYFVHYPIEGGYWDQPRRLMWIFETILKMYRKVLSEEMSKA